MSFGEMCIKFEKFRLNFIINDNNCISDLNEVKKWI